MWAEGGNVMIRLLYGLVLLMLVALPSLRGDGCEFWFGVSETDPTHVTQLEVSPGDTFTLYSWISADQPSWDWIGAVGFPIVFDTSYIEITNATFNADLGPTYSPDSLYMFAGVDWPGMGEVFADTLESQALWYISVCFNSCLSCNGSPHYLGSATFLVKSVPDSVTVVIDTLEYPPSNNALVVDNTGWSECTPQWTPFAIGPREGVLYTRGDADASGGAPNIVDASYVISHILPNPNFPCQRAADANASNAVNIIDASYILSHILPNPNFPAPNYPECGTAPSDTLPCDSFPPCGKSVLNSFEYSSGLSVEIGKVYPMEKGLYVAPLFIRNEVPVAGFQLTLGYDASSLDVLKADDRNCESADYDFYDFYVGDGKIMLVGLVSLEPTLNGIAKRYIEPGKHKIAEIVFRSGGKAHFEVLDALFADINSKGLIPASLATMNLEKLPVSYSLSQNEPNPFDGSTVIRYALPVDSRVELVIYNAAGQRVRTLVRGYQSAGYKSVRWDGRDSAGKRVSPGVYFYKFKAGDFKAIKKLILAK